MSTFGIEFAIGVPSTVTDLEDKVDSFYDSLSRNFGLVSVDVALNLEKGSINVLLGVNCPADFDAESLVSGVATEAISKALLDSGIDEPDEQSVWQPSARIREFV
jgi:hypothetical protein